MATTTTNLGLVKPDGTDKVLILVLNGNFDKIDAAIGAIRAQQIPAEVITAAVEEYLAGVDIAGGATPEQVQQIEKNVTDIQTLTNTVNGLDADKIGAAKKDHSHSDYVPSSRVNQDLKTSSDVQFNTVTANVVYGAVFME